jgi:hypothetical protein
MGRKGHNWTHVIRRGVVGPAAPAIATFVELKHRQRHVEFALTPPVPKLPPPPSPDFARDSDLQ